MKRRKIIFLILVFGVLLIGSGIAIIAYEKVSSSKYKQNKLEFDIVEQDVNFRKKVESFNERRSSYYNEVASNLFTETVEDSYDDWILILDKYTESVDAVNDSSSFLKENCVNKHYSNSDIMNKCDAFIIAYETVINYYTKDILSFNDVIEEFRREKDLNDNDTNFKNYVSKYQYVDINSDGEFIGKSSN